MRWDSMCPYRTPLHYRALTLTLHDRGARTPLHLSTQHNTLQHTAIQHTVFKFTDDSCVHALYKCTCIFPWNSFTKYPNPGARPALMRPAGQRVSIIMFIDVRSVGLNATSLPPTLTMRKSSSVIWSRMKMSCASSYVFHDCAAW